MSHFRHFLLWIQTTAFCTDFQLQGKLFNSSLIFKEVFQNKFNFLAAKKLIITLQLKINLSLEFPLHHLLKDTFDSENCYACTDTPYREESLLTHLFNTDDSDYSKSITKAFTYTAVQTERPKDSEISIESL